MSKKLSRNEKIGAYALAIAVIGLAVVILLPEIRALLHLDKPVAAVGPVTPPAQIAPTLPEVKPADKSPATTPHVKGGHHNSPAVGTITQGPGSITQIGGQGNRATIIGTITPTPRVLLPDQSLDLTNAVRPYPATILILYVQNDDEAYRFAKQIGDALTNAGWTLKQPVTAAMYFSEGGGPLYGMKLGWNGPAIGPGQRVDLDATTSWGSLGRMLNRYFREDFTVLPSPNTDANLIRLDVFRNPNSKSN